MRCRICDSSDLTLVIDLGEQPWGNDFLRPEIVGKEKKYPLELVFCTSCFTSQLNYTVKKETMFSNHSYLSGVTSTLAKHFASVACETDAFLSKIKLEKTVLDIGSNDGTQLKSYQKLGYDVLGVESSTTTAAIANKNGVQTSNEFFNLQFAKKLNKKFSVINASGVFFHLEELHSVCEGIRFSLDANGVFVVQFIYLQEMVKKCAFDQIYHEHLLYYNIAQITKLLEMHGLTLFDAYVCPIHGGSIIAHACHQGVYKPTDRLCELRRKEEEIGSNTLGFMKHFAEEIKKVRSTNLAMFAEWQKQGKTVYGMGAPVKGNTLLNYFGLKRDNIPYLIEKNPLRRGLVAPGSHIPILIEDEMTVQPDVYYVLAWNFKDEILSRYAHLINKGVEFYFPVQG